MLMASQTWEAIGAPRAGGSDGIVAALDRGGDAIDVERADDRGDRQE